MVQSLAHYIRERDNALNGETKDPIISKFKFSNNNRIDDRQTRWAISHIIDNNNLDIEVKILNTILFRLINKGLSMELINAPFSTFPIDEARITKIVDDFTEDQFNNVRRCVRYKWINGAYLTTELHVQWRKTDSPYRINDIKDKRYDLLNPGNIMARVSRVVNKYSELNIPNNIMLCDDPQSVIDELKIIDGIGNFIAYQIYLDLCYITEFKFTDNDIVLSGPGSKRGINLIIEDKNKTSYEDLIFYITENQEKLNISSGLSVANIEHILCEFDKYIRYKQGKSINKSNIYIPRG